jgi:hypothetical protein
MRNVVGALTQQVALKSKSYVVLPPSALANAGDLSYQRLCQNDPDLLSSCIEVKIEKAPKTEKVRLAKLQDRRYPKTVVSIEDMDTLNCGRLASEGGKKRVLCLNMANEEHAGGGWERGRYAQEEELFRRYVLLGLRRE